MQATGDVQDAGTAQVLRALDLVVHSNTWELVKMPFDCVLQRQTHSDNGYTTAKDEMDLI